MLRVRIYLLTCIYFLALATPTFAQTTPAKKWNPGHYLSISGSTQAEFTTQVQKLHQPDYRNIKGVKLKIHWKTLESTQNQYNFALIDAIINAMPSDRQLFMMVLDRDFQNACGANPRLPTYILNHTQYPAVNLHTGRGCVAQIWRTPIMDRYITLYNALGDRYDNHPQFGGLFTAETATNIVEGPGLPATQLEMNQLLLPQFKRLHTQTAPHFQKSFVIQSINFLMGPGGDKCISLRELADSMKTSGGALSNPDSVPWESTGPPCNEYPVYTIYRERKTQMPIMPGNDTSFLGDPNNVNGNRISFNGQVMDMPNLVEALYKTYITGFTFQGQQIQGFGAHYIFWNNHFYSRDGGSQQGYVEAVLNFINQPDHQTIQTCPTNISCGNNPTPTPTPTTPPVPQWKQYLTRWFTNNGGGTDNIFNLFDWLSHI